jgi:osmotically-inducible protein OsmY
MRHRHDDLPSLPARGDLRGWALDAGIDHVPRPAREGADQRGRGPRGFTRSDARLREDIAELLTHDWHVDASEIEIECSNGVVTLTGVVAARDLKHYIEDLVADCAGVRDVANRLSVRPAEFPPK